MMELLKDFPKNVLAIEASGRVTRRDYDDVLIPAARAAFAHSPKVRCYYQIGPDFTGFDVGAMWKDFLIGTRHWKNWECVAVVTDVAWIKHAMSVFGLFMPCPVRLFAITEAAQARAWVTSSAASHAA